MSHPILANKHYEVPSCPICMEDLTDNLISTNCGHVFHSTCISENMGYRNECPNCRMRILASQLHLLNYSINTTILEDKDRINFLDSLRVADQQKYMKLIRENEEMYHENTKFKKENQDLKGLVTQKDNLLACQAQVIKTLTDEKSTDKKEIYNLKNAIGIIELQNEQLIKDKATNEKKIIEYEKDIAEYAKLKDTMNSITNDKDDAFLKTVKEKMPPAEQAKIYYEYYKLNKSRYQKLEKELGELRKDRDLEVIKRKQFEEIIIRRNKDIERLTVENKTLKQLLDESLESNLSTDNNNINNSNGSMKRSHTVDDKINCNSNPIQSKDKKNIMLPIKEDDDDFRVKPVVKSCKGIIDEGHRLLKEISALKNSQSSSQQNSLNNSQKTSHQNITNNVQKLSQMAQTVQALTLKRKSIEGFNSENVSKKVKKSNDNVIPNPDSSKQIKLVFEVKPTNRQA